MSASLDELIAEMSDWINEGKESLHPSHLMRIRVSKLVEELGEVEDAIIGVEGSNPRKGYYGTEDDVANELLDVATGALYAHYHVRGGDTMGWLDNHIRKQAQRRRTMEVQDG